MNTDDAIKLIYIYIYSQAHCTFETLSWNLSFRNATQKYLELFYRRCSCMLIWLFWHEFLLCVFLLCVLLSTYFAPITTDDNALSVGWKLGWVDCFGTDLWFVLCFILSFSLRKLYIVLRHYYGTSETEQHIWWRLQA